MRLAFINVVFVTIILRALDITTNRPLPALPHLDSLVHERAESSAYHQDASNRQAPQVAVQITLHGSGFAATPTHDIRLPPGSALCFVTQRPLRYGQPANAAEPWEFLYANINGAAAIAIAEGLITAHGHRFDLGRSHPLVRSLLERLPERGRRHLRWNAAESARVSGDLLQALIDAVPASEESDLLDEAMHLLLSDLAAPLDVANVAARLGVSREHLTRHFAKELGCSPAAWQRDQRLRHACSLLRGGCAVAETATRCGFATPSHFIQSFKRQRGVTPARYARGEGAA